MPALSCSAVWPHVIDRDPRHPLLACRELREAGRYLLFGDGDPVAVLPLESERDRMYRLLETRRDLGRRRHNGGGIPHNSYRTHCQPAKLRAPARDEIRTVRITMAPVRRLQARGPSLQKQILVGTYKHQERSLGDRRSSTITMRRLGLYSEPYTRAVFDWRVRSSLCISRVGIVGDRGP